MVTATARFRTDVPAQTAEQRVPLEDFVMRILLIEDDAATARDPIDMEAELRSAG
jgi:hypothetical protein